MDAQTATYHVLDSAQGLDATQGWKVQQLNNLRVTARGLELLSMPTQPQPINHTNDVWSDLGGLHGIAIAPNGTLYVSDRQQHLIFKIIRFPEDVPPHSLCQPIVSPLPYFGGFGTAPRQLNEPRGLAISPEGRLYIADSQNHRIQVLNLKGETLQTILGQPVAGDALGEFNQPWDVAVSSTGDIYICDTGNHRLQKFDIKTHCFSIIDGTQLNACSFQIRYGPHQRERFVYISARQRLEHWPQSPRRLPQSRSDITILSEDIPSVSAARQAILTVIDAVGSTDILVESTQVYPVHLLQADEPEPSFDQPTHIAIDPLDRIYVIDTVQDIVKVLNSNGWVINTMTPAKSELQTFHPTAVAISQTGAILIANGHQVEHFHFEDDHFHYEGVCSCGVTHCSGIAVNSGHQAFFA